MEYCPYCGHHSGHRVCPKCGPEVYWWINVPEIINELDVENQFIIRDDDGNYHPMGWIRDTWNGDGRYHPHNWVRNEHDGIYRPWGWY